MQEPHMEEESGSNNCVTGAAGATLLTLSFGLTHQSHRTWNSNLHLKKKKNFIFWIATLSKKYNPLLYF